MKTINADDIRLQELPFSFDGRDFKLRATMNAVLDVQNQYDGDLMASLDVNNPFQTSLTWLVAMMNSYAEAEGWADFTPYTTKSVGAKLLPKQIPVVEIMNLVRASLFVPAEAADQQSEGHEKN